MPRQNLLYKNIYHALCSRIFSGEFPPGKRLPSMNELAQQYNVSIITIRATFKMLQEIGLIRVSRGKEAMVIYDAGDPESGRSFLQWLAGRKYTLSEVYQLAARLAGGTAAYGASHAGPAEHTQLAEIARKAASDDLPVNRLALSLAEYYFILIRPLHNDLLEDLMRACDRFLAISILLVAQDSDMREEFQLRVRSFIIKLHGLVCAGKYQEIDRDFVDYAMQMREFILEHLQKLTARYEVADELHFDWTISGNENLYTEIANDLILRISTGEFFDGDYLPSEQKLQKEYGTSSKTIRSALVALNECDIVHTINGVGTVVTYLSPSDPPGQPITDPNEAYILFYSLQLVMLGSAGLVREAFRNLCDEEIRITRERVERLLAAPGKQFYSYLGIFMDVAVQSCPSELTRRIYRQFHTRLFLLCHKRKHFEEIFADHLERSMPHINDALQALQARDAERYIQALHQILSLVGQSTLRICEASGLHCDVLLPY